MSAISQPDALAAVHQLQNDPMPQSRMDELLEALQQFVAERSDVTLRDEFAIAALSGVSSNPESGCNSSSDLAYWAYQVADAMLKARAS